MFFHFARSWLYEQHYAYENPLFRAVCAAVFCFILVLIAGPSVIRRLLRAKLGDRPEFDCAPLNELMKDKAGVPTMGGILIVFAVLAGTLVWADLSNFYIWMGLLCLIWLGTVGAVDDALKLTAGRRGGSRQGLRMHEKLLFQIGLSVVLALFILSFGDKHMAVATVGEQLVPAYRILSLPFYKEGIVLGAVAFTIITVLVTTFTSNAVNLTDGLDGLAAGCVAICTLAFMLLTDAVGSESVSAKLLLPHVPGSGELTVICGSILGACLGFLWYNCHPARVFMGDTGSLPLGGVLGYVAIVTRQEVMLGLVGGIFVVEGLSVLLQVGYFKWTGGKRLLRCAPIHHHFQMGGWSETQTVVRFWLIAGVLAACALATVKLR